MAFYNTAKIHHYLLVRLIYKCLLFTVQMKIEKLYNRPSNNNKILVAIKMLDQW